jgi:hypothetical protein
MSGQHTQGRIEVAQILGGDWIVQTVERNKFGQAALIAANLTEANARRLTACWNACEGLSTEQLEVLKKPVPSNILALIGERDGARIELAAASALLREVVKECEDWEAGTGYALAVNNTAGGKLVDRIRNYLDACNTLGGEE